LKAKKSDWKNFPISDRKEKIPFERFYSDVEAEKIFNGSIPKTMEDKWFIFSEGDWVYFHRSWTGHCIFALKLDGSPSGVCVAEAWVTRDSEHFNSSGVESDINMLSGLVKSILVSGDGASQA